MCRILLFPADLSCKPAHVTQSAFLFAYRVFQTFSQPCFESIIIYCSICFAAIIHWCCPVIAVYRLTLADHYFHKPLYHLSAWFIHFLRSLCCSERSPYGFSIHPFTSSGPCDMVLCSKLLPSMQELFRHEYIVGTASQAKPFNRWHMMAPWLHVRPWSQSNQLQPASLYDIVILYDRNHVQICLNQMCPGMRIFMYDLSIYVAVFLLICCCFCET